MKDEKKVDGAVDKSSEQWFRKSDAISYAVWKIWSPATR